MKSVDPGVLDHSYCFPFTPAETTKKLFYYPTWCGRYYCTAEYFKQRKSYPELLLVYVRNGQCNLHYRGQTHTVGKGEVFFIDCQQPHHYHASDGLEFLYIHFDGLNAHALYKHIMTQYGYVFQGGRCVTIGKMLYEIIERCKNDELISAAEFSLLIYQLIMIFFYRSEDSFSTELSPIDDAIHYIRENAEKKITLDELAEKAGVSKFHFSHLFKAETGYSPIEYVLSARLDRAKLLLKTSHLSISEIAYNLGYENPGSFINLFTRKVGSSPTQYRKS